MPSIDISRYKLQKPKPENNKSFSLIDLLNKDISFGKKQLSDKKKEAFYLELSTLISSGIDFRTALDLILVDQGKAKDKKLFESVKERVLAGSSLSESLRITEKFSGYEFHTLRIGEETGRIGEVLTDLAKFYKSKIQQRRKIISAITYPVIVLLTSLGAVFFMIKFVVPMFADIFLRFGGKLPWITSFILSVSATVDKYFIFFLLTVIAVGLSYFFTRSKEPVRKIISHVVLKIPVLGEITAKIYLARFANTMRLLISTNTPLLKSIGLVRQMIEFYPVEVSLLKVEQDILTGKSLYESLSQFGFYPSKLIQLIKVGEEVNRLDYFFEKIALQYTEEVEYRTNTISSLLEPLIIIFLGVIVGVILIAMYLPMFQMSNSF
ncbi:type II secretion system F family protein [Rubrolithibacter danxiaensis]|uniref:type II secretion system F family protein n=1 Tax=Rubrolithibacter danxiaensis TaxID=3390805 RepID=UPI003BF7F48E